MRTITAIPHRRPRWVEEVLGLLLAIAVLAALSFALGGCTRVEYRDRLVEATPVSTPTPVAVPTYVYPGPQDFHGFPGVPTLHAEINAATSRAFDCPVGSECRWPGLEPESALELIVRALRAQQLWAGRVNDEILVARECGTRWETYHQWNYNGRPLWAQPRSMPCAGEGCTGSGSSFRGIAEIDAGLCHG